MEEQVSVIYELKISRFGKVVLIWYFIFVDILWIDKTSFYSLVDRDMEGNEVKMDTFKGDVLCVVNVASKWGLTKQNYGEFIIMCW